MASNQIPEPLQCKTVFNRYLSNGRSNPKISKNEVHFFSNFGSGRTLPTQSTGPQPIQLVPKPCFFYRYLNNGCSNPKISKNEVHFFLSRILLLVGGRTPQIGTVHVSVTSPKKYFFPSRFGKTEIKNIKYICHHEKKT